MAEPERGRPRFPPGYGISESEEGLLPWAWASEQLARSRNYWICTTRPDGRPHAMPVWGVWDSGALYFSTSRESRKARNLERSPEVVVHLESGDDVVILEGAVERVGLEERVADAYEAKYDYRPSSDDTGDGAWLELRPRVAYAWREEDFPRTATRWSWKAGRRSSVS